MPRRSELTAMRAAEHSFEEEVNPLRIHQSPGEFCAWALLNEAAIFWNVTPGECVVVHLTLGLVTVPRMSPIRWLRSAAAKSFVE